MSKEKFERSKPHVNIGDIKTVDLGKSTTAAAINSAVENLIMYEHKILQIFINQYGEEEGKRRFEILKQEARERYNYIQNIGSTFEEREEGVNFSRER